MDEETLKRIGLGPGPMPGGLGPAPGSPAAIIADVYSVRGVRHAFLIDGIGEATVVVDSDEDDLEPVMEVLDQARPAGVLIDIVRPEDLGTLIDQRVADALVRQALVFKKAEVAAAVKRKRLDLAYMLLGIVVMSIGWLL